MAKVKNNKNSKTNKDKKEKKSKKKLSSGNIVRTIAIWIMLIAMIASLFAYAFSVIFS